MLTSPSYYKIGENEEIYIDSFIGCETYILPNNPSNLSKIRIVDVGNKLDIHPCIIKCNGHSINGKQEDLILEIKGIKLTLQFKENEGYTIF